MDMLRCPYCGHEFIVDMPEEFDPFNEELFQDYCPNCDHVVNVQVHVSIDYEVSKCQCQGVDHEWEPTQTFPPELCQMVCKHCGERRATTDEDRKKFRLCKPSDYAKWLCETNTQEEMEEKRKQTLIERYGPEV